MQFEPIITYIFCLPDLGLNSPSLFFSKVTPPKTKKKIILFCFINKTQIFIIELEETRSSKTISVRGLNTDEQVLFYQIWSIKFLYFMILSQ